MRNRSFRMALVAAVLLAAAYPATVAFAETRLFIPQFRFNGSEDTQLLIANQNDRDTTVDLWAFTSAGELLGQFQIPVKAHGTRALAVGEALQLKGTTVSGWVGVVSKDDGIQVSYTRIGIAAESFEAQQWASREIALTISDVGKSVVRLSNPNPFTASLTITGTDQAGGYLGIQQISLPAFSQIELPATSAAGGQASLLRVASNADVLAIVDAIRGKSSAPVVDNSEPDNLAIFIDSAASIGAYQLTLTFDPRAAQFSENDVEAGTAEGFDSKPLVVNIDNASGQITIASFQVGAHPNGRATVARLRTPRGVRFGIKVEEITGTAGNSLLGLPVGMVSGPR
jgi:P pilus assembly chaperone PapD